MTQQRMNAILRCFPNLVKFYINVDDSLSLLSPNELISSIVGSFPKLKDLYFGHLSRRVIHEHFQEWNTVRSALQHVTHLNIHAAGHSLNIRLTGDSISIDNGEYDQCLICSNHFRELTYIERLS